MKVWQLCANYLKQSQVKQLLYHSLKNVLMSKDIFIVTMCTHTHSLGIHRHTNINSYYLILQG